MDQMVAEHRRESERRVERFLDGEGHSAFLLMRCMAMVVSKVGIPRVTCSINQESFNGNSFAFSIA